MSNLMMTVESKLVTARRTRIFLKQLQLGMDTVHISLELRHRVHMMSLRDSWPAWHCCFDRTCSNLVASRICQTWRVVAAIVLMPVWTPYRHSFGTDGDLYGWNARINSGPAVAAIVCLWALVFLHYFASPTILAASSVGVSVHFCDILTGMTIAWIDWMMTVAVNWHQETAVHALTVKASECQPDLCAHGWVRGALEQQLWWMNSKGSLICAFYQKKREMDKAKLDAEITKLQSIQRGNWQK